MKLSTKLKDNGLATLFINKQEQINIGNKKVNIVLSPAYYWFKNEVLPVKNVAQAKKLAPSIFDGTIPDAEYSYQVIKFEENFWLFAYDNALIVAKLTALGIKSSQINQIYFAQSECYDLIETMCIDESFALVSNENILSMVPLEYLGTCLPYQEYFSKHKFSKHHISLNFFKNNFIDEKYIYRLIGVTVTFILIYFASYLILRQDLKQILTKEYTIKETYKLPQTSFELKGLKRSLEAKETKQLAYRENVKKLLSLKLKSGEYVKKLDISAKKASYEIVMKHAKRAEAIKSTLKKSFQITSAKVIDKTFYIGVAL
ncbi:MAG: hypothetical protein U9R50_00715 [Campylobacterota bacterium]|nr:hypothetical protein [Campylobacterota bacterium]